MTDDILRQIDGTLANTEDPAFGPEYWEPVDSRRPFCMNCGATIETALTSTGWTHIGDWKGVRCQGMLCGAFPASR